MKQNKLRRLKGRLTIARPQYSTGEDAIEITLTDDSSHVEPVSIKMSLEAFSKALFSEAYQPCEYEFQHDAPVGMVREHKTELVLVPGPSDRLPDLLAPYEIDGWKANPQDFANYHGWSGEPLPPGKKPGDGKMVRVAFVRYVPQKTEGVKP